MAKKSKAQIIRMMKRAEARGEIYKPPPSSSSSSSNDDTPKESPTRPTNENKESTSNEGTTTTKLSKEDQTKLQAARKLTKELAEIESNESLKAKERRSAKRKAEAIASEAVGGECSATDLLEWYKEYQSKHETAGISSSSSSGSKKQKKEVIAGESSSQRNKTPYIAFVGQLSFKTTKESLFQHIQESLKDEFEVSHQNVRIRLLTDAKTGKSRGMAFVEVDSPELLYALLRLHQTFWEGRRINVERSAGGRAHSESKKKKLEEFRKEQEEYMSGVVDKMLQEFHQAGTIQPDELDEGVIALFKRHSANIVQAALERYVESNGKEKENPSAYITCLVGKMAEEGIFEKDEEKNQAKTNKNNNARQRRPQDNNNNKRPAKKFRNSRD